MGSNPRKRRRPLAPSTFLLRNLRQTIPLTGVIVLAVLLVGGIVSMIDSIPLSIRTIYNYSRHSLGISPRGDPGLTAQMRAVCEPCVTWLALLPALNLAVSASA